MSSTQTRRGRAAPLLFAVVATVVIALAQMAVVPAAAPPHLAAAALPSTASTSWSDTVPAGLRTPTTTTTTVPPTTTTSTTTAPAPPPPPPTTVPALPPPPPPPSPATLPARGQATAWGCDAALAYLQAYAAPGFTLECPGYADGHQGMTCYDEPGACPGSALIAIAVPCPHSYMNEASNSWVLIGRSNAPIDPYGGC